MNVCYFFLTAYVFQGCNSYESPLLQYYSLWRFVYVTSLLRTHSHNYIHKGCNSYESPLTLSFLPERRDTRFSSVYSWGAGSVPQEYNLFEMFLVQSFSSPGIMPVAVLLGKAGFVSKGCSSSGPPLPCSSLLWRTVAEAMTIPAFLSFHRLTRFDPDRTSLWDDPGSTTDFNTFGWKLAIPTSHPHDS